MRRFILLGLSILTMVFMAVSPAFAHDWDGDGWDEEFGFWVLVPVFVVFDVDFDGIDDNFDCDFVFCHDFDDDDWDDHDWDDHHWEGPVHLID
ncbi:MAG: hypothetical protein M3N45_01625 [Actinomycetota bacterium]|nr:hypothetical protein [Actinomycetota bacterium]